MLAKPAANQRPSFRRQFNPAHAAAVRVLIARDEAFSDQAIDGHTNGSGSEPNFWADGVDRKRALVQENFQDAEIGVAQFCALDAPGGVGEQRLKSFHKNKPKMHAGRVLFFSGAFLFHCDFDLTGIILMSIYFKSIKLS